MFPTLGADVLRRELRGAAAAVAFLTVLPVGRLVSLGSGDLARAAPLFPIVGAAIGAGATGLGVLLGEHLPSGVAAAVALVAVGVITGGLHLDGLADTADALGGHTVEQSLAIMREPQIGSFGASAIALLLLVEVSALAGLVAAHRVAAGAAAFAVSRATAPVIAAALPYARAEGGLAQAVRDGGVGRASTAAVVVAGIVVAAGWAQLYWLPVVGAGCSVVAITLFRARFGGMTGDTLGAAVAVTEAVAVVTALGH